jgi:hypothetical protein
MSKLLLKEKATIEVYVASVMDYFISLVSSELPIFYLFQAVRGVPVFHRDTF